MSSSLDEQAVVSPRGVARTFFAITTVVFLASVFATIRLGQEMSGAMPMPGGWSMSMAWMRMPGQTWATAAMSFVWMWLLMMVAMMLPAITPALWKQHRFPAFVAAGYFAVWTLIGAALYPIGVLVALAEMRSETLARSVPLTTAIVVLAAGSVQLLPWKARQLDCCQMCDVQEDRRGAWKYGVRSGVRCALCCSGFMAAFVVLGVMSLGAMAAAAAAITVERIAARPAAITRALGAAMLLLGAALAVRAILH